MQDNTINGKTPEEIKKGLECCSPKYESQHWVTCNSECPFWNEGAYCRNVLYACIKRYIQQLECERDEARNDLDTLNYANTELHSAYEAMKRERDAAVAQLKEVDTMDFFYCSHCKHEELCDYNLNSCEDCENDCPCHTCIDMCNWQWRGVQEVT